MQIANIPAKYFVPFAQNDSGKVEIPVTTADPTRASQSLGFPPLTMQPPESGGVPPQGEDFNGAMNQIARIAWWLMAGGPFIYDSAFAANANINGYPQGAIIPTADMQGVWISAADNNTVNPDTVGTNWLPGHAYGQTNVTGLTNANVTLTPAQAIKPTIALTGTLTANINIIFPTWLRSWSILNNTTGAFTVTCKTAAGSGVVVGQGQTTPVRSDGTNIVSNATPGRLVNIRVFTTAGANSYVPSVGVNTILVECIGGGGGGGGVPASAASTISVASGGVSGAIARWYGVASAQTVTVGTAGIGGTAGLTTGTTGGTSSFGAILTAPGGSGGSGAGPTSPPITTGTGASLPVGTGGNVLNAPGQYGALAFVTSTGVGYSGSGGNTLYGTGGPPRNNTGAGVAGSGFGAGGGGALALASGAAAAGGNGTAGIVYVYEYT